MKYIYLISQPAISLPFGSIKSAIVVAESEELARQIHPGNGWQVHYDFPLWVSSPDQVIVKKLGIADSDILENVVFRSYSVSWIDDGK